jgi:hypothetical protein
MICKKYFTKKIKRSNSPHKLKTCIFSLTGYIEMGYDGIRYYDPLATGEEFVLFNRSKIKKIK